MTALETASSLQINELVGFNLTMAREDLCGAVMYNDTSRGDFRQIVRNFTQALHEALFGEYALVTIENVSQAASMVSRQLGCLVGQEMLELALIEERIEQYQELTGLPEATEYVTYDVIYELANVK